MIAPGGMWCLVRTLLIPERGRYDGSIKNIAFDTFTESIVKIVIGE